MTSKFKIKRINKQVRGATVYISKTDREHIGAEKGDNVIFDLTVPEVIKIINIRAWKKFYPD